LKYIYFSVRSGWNRFSEEFFVHSKCECSLESENLSKCSAMSAANFDLILHIQQLQTPSYKSGNGLLAFTLGTEETMGPSPNDKNMDETAKLSQT